MRQVLRFVLGAALAAGMGFAPVAVAGATSTDAWDVTGHTAGAVKSVDPGDHLTFAFRMVNDGSTADGVWLALRCRHVSHACGGSSGDVQSARVLRVTCISPAGTRFNPDGDLCEWSPIRQGQSVGIVVRTVVTDRAGTVVAYACALHADSGRFGPCATVQVRNRVRGQG